MPEWDKDAAADSTEQAKVVLQEIADTMTEEEKEGVRKFGEWWKTWYNGNAGNHPTGHKALAQIFKARGFRL